ncbi:MAG TPA: hypothetical protein VFT34_15380 [Verrucomicrobiae bacterium]|nr:hypothetical protein [Verrucomicrobiae bacterium]
MLRPWRVQYPGTIYLLRNRGDRREKILRDDTDRRTSLSTLGQVSDKTGWQIHAFCLMSPT